MKAFVTEIDGVAYYRDTDNPKLEYKLVGDKFVKITKKIKHLKESE